MSRQEQNIAQLKLVLFESNPFKLSEETDLGIPKLHKLISNEILPEEAAIYVFNNYR